MTKWLIGIDDTDVPGTRGTGSLARSVLATLAGRGLRACGVTRHQLLVHPDVPYTSHNSANCVAAEGGIAEPAVLFAELCRFVAAASPEGSDPGVCMAPADAVRESATEFGRRAQREIVRRSEAAAIASEAGLLLAGLAGTQDGMIGALAAVGLRAGGGDGRFVELGRVRELAGRVSVQELLDSGVDAVYTLGPTMPAAEEQVETLGWARPRLVGGRSVLLVERSTDDGVDWIVSDRRKGGGDRDGRAPREPA